MGYILFVIITTAGRGVVFQTQNLKTEIGCLQAVEKTITAQKKLGIDVVAFCIKD